MITAVSGAGSPLGAQPRVADSSTSSTLSRETAPPMPNTTRSAARLREASTVTAASETVRPPVRRRQGISVQPALKLDLGAITVPVDAGHRHAVAGARPVRAHRGGVQVGITDELHEQFESLLPILRKDT